MQTNYEMVEKLSQSFIRFLDAVKIKNDGYKQLSRLSARDKLIFINTYIRPFRNTLDALIIDNIEKNGDKVENYKAEDIAKLKKYMEAFLELI